MRAQRWGQVNYGHPQSCAYGAQGAVLPGSGRKKDLPAGALGQKGDQSAF